ncbi:MAG: dockerin type I repeat-containing protein [Oscillospiraceae bacterium]|nr:dockerin type I repeat-containing protein [Oscillospiraceae bacterium]
MFTDDFTGRRCLFITMKEYDREIAFETAQELYNTGLFYSVEMNASEELTTNDEPLPFEISPDGGYVGHLVVAFTLLNHSEESKNWDADFLNQALDVNVIDYVDGDLMGDNEGRRGLIIYLNQDDKQTAFEIAQKLYNTGLFHHLEMNYLCGNDTAPNTDFMKGDVSGDADVNILDVISINKAVLGKETLSQEQNQAADLDGNGKVDANDALLLLKYIVGLEEI